MKEISAALREARDPTTPPALLVALGERGEPDVLEALAENPNTPQEVLSSLAVDYPAEFLRNPAMLLLLLEEPAFFWRLSGEAVVALLTEPGLPEAVRAVLLSHPDTGVRVGAPQNLRVKHPRHGHVAGIDHPAGDLLPGVEPRRRRADQSLFGNLGVDRNHAVLRVGAEPAAARMVSAADRTAAVILL